MKTIPSLSLLRRRHPGLAAFVMAALLACALSGLGAQEEGSGTGAPASLQLPPGAQEAAGIRPMGPDLSRNHYEEGRRLFEARLFGQALASFQAAVAERKDQYQQALARVEAIATRKELSPAKDSISGVMKLLAQRDLIDAELSAIDREAGSSLRKKADLYLSRRLSADFQYFLKALVLVLDRREASTLKDSLAGLKAACSELAAYPEAEYWIGKVYAMEAEPRLAELQYRKAWDLRASLEIPDERFDILMTLTELYGSQKSWYSYEECLLKAAGEDPLFAARQAFLREALERALGQEGFDRFYGLYRSGFGPWTRAEKLLGEFYLRNGRPQALVYLAIPANAILSRCVSRIAEKDSSWEFLGLQELLPRIEADRELASFARAEGLYEALYELGLALDGGGYRESARDIWRVLGGMKGIEPWNRSALQALAAAARR